MTDHSRYDTDPDALAWARTRVQQYLDRLADFEQQAKTKGDHITEYGCKAARAMAERHFLGDGGCTIGVFDERLPALAAAVNHSIPPAIDRAMRRDHSLCGTHPCSDCR
ncbi:hypothetical protein ACIRU8_39205 [Streptomyces sp. NPDC101175]|uniref:hypothetical protein n=1 Tax=Streptomyces sp. NPDC101175 TaxID=3366123 RepID=UPI0038376441